MAAATRALDGDRLTNAKSPVQKAEKGRALHFAIVEQAASIVLRRWRDIGLAGSHTSSPLI
jgi:hypothetical protein